MQNRPVHFPQTSDLNMPSPISSLSFQLRTRNSIRGFVRPSVGPSVDTSRKVGKRAFPPLPTRPQLVWAVYPALLERRCLLMAYSNYARRNTRMTDSQRFTASSEISGQNALLQVISRDQLSLIIYHELIDTVVCTQYVPLRLVLILISSLVNTSGQWECRNVFSNAISCFSVKIVRCLR